MLDLRPPYRPSDPFPAGNQYHSCNFTDMPGDAPAAKKHYLHALMAFNCYSEGKGRIFFVIPGWEVRRWESESDLQLEAYARPSWDAPEEIVVAFAGTDSGTDWANNFSLWEPPQYTEGIKFVRSLQSQHRTTKMWVVGHSLGGGIALNVASRVENVEAVVFNSSPRSTYGETAARNPKTAFYEVGEGLQVIRLNRLQLYLKHPGIRQIPYNFLSFKYWRSFKPAAEHGMYYLARGMLLTAIKADDDNAKKLFVVNVRRHMADAPGKEIPTWCKCDMLYPRATEADQ